MMLIIIKIKLTAAICKVYTSNNSKMFQKSISTYIAMFIILLLYSKHICNETLVLTLNCS